MSHGRDTAPKPYGTVACFETPEQLLDAARAATGAGFKEMDAYSPIPVHGLTDIIGFKDERLHSISIVGGLSGFVAGAGLEAWASAVAYPHNVGGKPLISWPMFVPVAYECTILLTCFACVGGLFALSSLPKPHHPVMNAEAYGRATQDRFLLCVEAHDPRYSHEKVASLMNSVGAESVEFVMTSEGY